MTETILMNTLLIFVCIILIYIILGKSQKISYRVFFFFKSESPATIDVFHIQVVVHPTQFLQNLSFLGMAGAETLENPPKYSTFEQLMEHRQHKELQISKGQITWSF